LDENGDGNVDCEVMDSDRDGRWDLSVHDIDFDGKWDLVGFHPDGKIVASRFESYTKVMAAR
jgi:hypothetical protein